MKLHIAGTGHATVKNNYNIPSMSWINSSSSMPFSSKPSSYTTLWKPLRTWKIKIFYQSQICRKLFDKHSAQKNFINLIKFFYCSF